MQKLCCDISTLINICMYIYMYTHIYICIHARVCAHIRTYTHTYIHTHAHTLDTHTHTYIYTYIHTYIHTHTHSHTYIHTYIHTCIHTYTHTHTHACTWSQEEEEEADKGRADLGDEVFGIGAFANENEDDVLMKVRACMRVCTLEAMYAHTHNHSHTHTHAHARQADDPNVSLPYYMARGRKGAFPRKQLLKATSSLKPQQLSASASPRARAHPSEYGVPLPLA